MDEKPIPAVNLDVHMPSVALNPGSAQRCVADKQAVTSLVALPGFRRMLESWRGREQALLRDRVTDAPATLEGNRRKARLYRLVRTLLEWISASGDEAAAWLRSGQAAGAIPQAALDEMAALTDQLAGMLGQPTIRDRKDEYFGTDGNAQRDTEAANDVAAALAHPGWRVVIGILAGLAWAHWLMLGDGAGDDAEHQDSITVIAAMLGSAQNVLQQGREAALWFQTRAGETA